MVVTYPVSIGRMDWQTPLGGTRIVTKTRNPSWRPPQSIKDAALAEGEPLPDVIPPGPDNPLGTRALRLGLPGYLIHGTNKPFGVGMRVTHGCVRMTPEAIEAFFDRVKVGTRVAIVNQAVKVGWLEGTLFVEVHPPLDEHVEPTAAWFQLARELVEQAIGERRVAMDEDILTAELQAHSGVPVPIGFELHQEKPEEHVESVEPGSGEGGTNPSSESAPEWSIPPPRDELF
jgi:L,D-transpeptidase ErfK/SrfK